MASLLNEQFGKELYASNLYLSISSYFENQSLEGFANFFIVQSDEEHGHAMRIFDYLHDVDAKIEMPAIAKPPDKFKSTVHAFEETLKQEKQNSKDIYTLVKQSLKDNEFATHTFLQWFVSEQVEEEASIKRILEQLNMIGNNKSALFLLDKDLSNRKATTE